MRERESERERERERERESEREREREGERERFIMCTGFGRVKDTIFCAVNVFIILTLTLRTRFNAAFFNYALPFLLA